MLIGIIEICEPNHYTSVCALADTYSINRSNKVIIYTVKHIAKFFANDKSNVELVIKSDDISIYQFLSEISLVSLDRLHINTISNYYKEFANIKWPKPLYFTVHNIEQWYDNPVASRFKVLIEKLSTSFNPRYKGSKLQPLIMFVKDFKRQHYRYKFINGISKGIYKIIVYSESQRKYLLRYIPAQNILKFPFCLSKDLEDKSELDSKLRICIPGTVSNAKRDYSGLFELLLNNPSHIAGRFVIDLLGFMPVEDRFLLDFINRLQDLGIEIVYNLDFIDEKAFDERLSLCDIILGNLKVQLNSSQKYGETKETGVIFNVIKSGKPALVPIGYKVDKDLENACLYYSDYKELFIILQSLAVNRNNLQKLKQQANKLSEKYTPTTLYPVLVN